MELTARSVLELKRSFNLIVHTVDFDDYEVPGLANVETDNGDFGLRIRPQFGIRTLLAMLFLTSLGLLLWQSIPAQGKPILYGQIVDANGAPIPNVQIILHSGMATRFPNQTTKTDSRGKFRFAPLETGSTIISENGDFNTLFVGIRVTHPEYRAVDGADWWDISVPRIKNRKHPWNLVMTKISTDNAN